MEPELYQQSLNRLSMQPKHYPYSLNRNSIHGVWTLSTEPKLCPWSHSWTEKLCHESLFNNSIYAAGDIWKAASNPLNQLTTSLGALSLSVSQGQYCYYPVPLPPPPLKPMQKIMGQISKPEKWKHLFFSLNKSRKWFRIRFVQHFLAVSIWNSII